MASEPSSAMLKTPLDSAAVGELFDEFHEPIHRYCIRRLYFREVAEDAVSEIFLTMARRIGEFRGKSMRDFRAWLYVIAANQVNETLRRKVRGDRLLDSLAERVRGQVPDDRQRRWTALYRSLVTLDDDQQHLISLRFFEGLSHDEIARLVGRKAGSVRVKIHRALKVLRPTLQRMLDDDCVWEDCHER